MEFTIENETTGEVLGTFQAESEKEALDQLAIKAGFKEWEDIPKEIRKDYRITKTVDFKGK